MQRNGLENMNKVNKIRMNPRIRAHEHYLDDRLRESWNNPFHP